MVLKLASFLLVSYNVSVGIMIKTRQMIMVTSSYNPEPDEKLVPIMVYTPQRLIWGNLITKEVIRVSTWLQTEMAPKYLHLSDVYVLYWGSENVVKPLQLPDLYIETNQIMAYHIMPPADEKPYYDPEEPNRKMEPVTALVGVFRFDCAIRLAEQSDLKTFLGVQKGEFLPVFDVVMSSPLIPSIKGVQSPFVLVRQGTSLFSSRDGFNS